MNVSPTAAFLWAFAGGAAAMFGLFALGAAALSASRRDWPFAFGRLLWSLPCLGLAAYALWLVLRALGIVYYPG
jgi:hypothetical protein